MKTLHLIGLLFLPLVCLSQTAHVVVFNHDLRWADETRFPNYFLIPELREAVQQDLSCAFIEKFDVSDVLFPEEIAYKIYEAFGKQKTDMPRGSHQGEPEIGIFSFITRATVGFAMIWRLKLVVKQDGAIIYDREVSHELEYFNPSGYLESRRWMSEAEFRQIFNRLTREALGLLPFSDEKIILGSLESFREKVQDFIPQLRETTLVIRGAWREGGNYGALIVSETDTISSFQFKQGFLSQVAPPSFSQLMAGLFTSVTGLDIAYDQYVRNQINCTILFADTLKYGVRLKWIDVVSRSVKSDEDILILSDPVVSEVYDERAQIGYFVYAYWEEVNATEQTQMQRNLFSGMKTMNTLGIDRIHSIKGVLSGKEVYAAYNEGEGLIVVRLGEVIAAAMMVQNINPDNTSVSGRKLSENKTFVISSSQNIKKVKLTDSSQAEWYPLYFNENISSDDHLLCAQTLICLFSSMGIAF
jgi:hypothetical protein